jgi:hypothetical protein
MVLLQNNGRLLKNGCGKLIALLTRSGSPCLATTAY